MELEQLLVMVTGINWFFWSTGPKSISRTSASQQGNPLPWPTQLPCLPPREVLTCDTNLPGDQNAFNTIQIRAAKIWRNYMVVHWKNLDPSAISSALATAFVQITRF